MVCPRDDYEQKVTTDHVTIQQLKVALTMTVIGKALLLDLY